MKLIAAALALVVAGGAGIYAVRDYLPKQGAQAAVRKMAKDPDPVFRNLRIVRDKAVCGEVNVRNLYGGYVGFHRFSAEKMSDGEWVVSFETKPGEAPADQAHLAQLWNEYVKINCD